MWLSISVACETRLKKMFVSNSIRASQKTKQDIKKDLPKALEKNLSRTI